MTQVFQFPEAIRPDRDNLATILAMAAYVTAALEDGADDQVAGRLARLRACLAEAKKYGMFPDIFAPVIDRMIDAVEARRVERAEADFAAGIGEFASDGLSAFPTPVMVTAGVQAGAPSPSIARRVFTAMRNAAGATSG
jgi:hypothetical protein